MLQKRHSALLYILATIILLVSASYVYNRINHRTTVRQARAEHVLQFPELHQLTLVTNHIYYAGTDFIATVQLNDMDGQPIKANLQVTLFQYEAGTDSKHFSTDYLGRADISFPIPDTFPIPEWENRWTDLNIRVDSELGFEYFTRSINFATIHDKNLIIHFDKGLYNPGDDVLFRILALDNATARPFATEFTVSIFDGNDNRVYHQSVQTSNFGIFGGRFSLADEVNSGLYRLTVEYSGTIVSEERFEVRPYVLPQFAVTLQTTQNEYNIGDTIYITGTARYFFDEPVNQGTVSVFINNEPKLTLTELDEHGMFSLTHIAENPGQYNIWAEVIDNSNFRQEAILTVTVADGPFEIDLMPEHGYLIQGMPNTIYIFTHSASGAPIRTHLQLTGRGFSRQVATDENGIGMFILEDVENENLISVRAVDMYGNNVQRDFMFDSVSRNIAISTDWPRYAMGDTIYVSIHGRDGGTYSLFIYKNDQLLQIKNTDQNHVALNLGDIYGLIDIHAVWLAYSDHHHWQYEFLPSARRTIFIDPGHFMHISVQSDRPEYRPGEFANLNIGVTDQRGIPLEAALLVNIVDEAVLNVAANDLSICNIRLALEGIRFSPDLDAATLYASLIAGASEQAITRLLLRQGDTSPMVRTDLLINHRPENYLHYTSWDNFTRGLRNFFRIWIIVAVSVFFFITLRSRSQAHAALKLTSLKTEDVLTEENWEQSISKKRERISTCIVILSLIAVAIALMFISGCGAGGNNDNFATPAEAPQPVAEAADFDAAPMQPAADFTPATPPPAQDVFESVDAEAAPEPPPIGEIETQTARVRRLFLETMLFVPELIARDGQANLDFMLADNITTWNIQVVGNTMDGIVGHTQSSIRVFQPFFVDFELPRNSIRHDRISIPVTVFNYTEYDQDVILTIAEMDWFTLHTDPVQTLFIASNQSQMVYIPITITDFGNFVFRAYADTHGYADAAERGIRVNPEGFGIHRVVSAGRIENSTWRHLLFIDEHIADTRSATITFHPSAMSQVIEGMENIFRMPFGCFEQTSSILYPNILALQFMQQQNIINPQLKERALRYISSGYQRMLTFEVSSQPGGFSLFGHAPAETVLTAYGLMQFTALSDVYTIDQRVLNRMAAFLFDGQNMDGTFQIQGWHGSNADEFTTANAYIAWALSEAFPRDQRLDITVDYLISQLDSVSDNYTLALIANTLINTNHYMAQQVVNRLHSNVIRDGETAYLTSTSRDFMGAFGWMQDLQTTALTSIAFSGLNAHDNTNNLLINYILQSRDSWGTWHSTQATILCLKALVRQDPGPPLEDGQITLTVGSDQRIIDVDGDNSLDFYQVRFTALEAENIMDIQFPNIGRMVYSISLNYFVPYDSVELNRGFEITSTMQTRLAVHERVEQTLQIINTSGHFVDNAVVAITIPQGFRVDQSSLSALMHRGIERYETRHDNINLYLRDIMPGEIINLSVAYRPAFPVAITGGHARVFDYYNPSIEGFLMPVDIVVE